MRKYSFIDNNATVIVGSAKEISRLYKRLGKRDEFCPVFTDVPMFNARRMYGVVIEVGNPVDFGGWPFYVVSEYTISAYLADGLIAV